jgi:hypothetical protein
MSEPLDAEVIDERTARQSLANASSRTRQHRFRLDWLSSLASLLVVAGLIGGALALFRSPFSSRSPATGPDTWLGGSPVTREAKAGGLDFVMHVTPGPYFLGELLVADLSLRNDSRTSYTLAGPSHAGGCGAAVFLEMTGSGSDTEAQYVLPVADSHSCPFLTSTLTPGATLTFHEFLPVSKSGEVTLQSGARFLQTVTDPDGSRSITSAHSPLDGLWPALKVSVAATTPPGRQITVQREGNQVQIHAPLAAQAYLHYLYTVSCHGVQGGTVGTGNYVWESISTDAVHEPDCGDYGSQVIQWSYAVSAPGYAIASGSIGS